MPAEWFRLVELPELVGCTYRQAHYWTQVGWIRATPWPSKLAKNDAWVPAPHRSSGHPLMVEHEEARVLEVMVRLVRGGVDANRAASYARQLVELMGQRERQSSGSVVANSGGGVDANLRGSVNANLASLELSGVAIVLTQPLRVDDERRSEEES